MAKVKKQSTSMTPVRKSKVFDTKSVKISRNKSTKPNTKPQKTNETSSITLHTRCALKLKRFESPKEKSVTSVPIEEVCRSPASLPTENNSTSTKMSKNICVRLRRIHPDGVHPNASPVSNSTPLRGKRVDSEEPKQEDKLNKENTTILKKTAGEQSTTKRHNSIGDVIKSSTPLKRVSVHLRREPFKVLNLQQSLSEFQNAIEDINEEENILKHPTITHATREGFKKLSLSKSKKHLEQKQKDNKNISRFEPLRNSTLYGLATSKSADDTIKFDSISCSGVERMQDLCSESKKDDVHTSSMENSKSFSSQNLANKSHIIEQLLLSDLDENPGDTVKPLAHFPPQPAQNKTTKFFHRTLQTSTDPTNTLTKTQPVNHVKRSKKIIQKRRITKKDKLSIGNVYEFLSQSQTSDSDHADKHLDPAADIIKKLIAEGKVQVATHKEGTGKLQFKRKNVPKKRAVVQRKQKKAREKKKNIEVPQCESQNCEHADDDIAADVMLMPVEPIEATATYVSNSKQSKDNTAGGDSFSNLARSVLISQAGKNEKYRKRVTDQRKLLEAARKFVSTPFKRALPSLDKTSIMSPIFAQGTPSPKPSCASPWRVDNDAHLPSVFYFNRNSDQLPSFSSDYIPSTPRKQQKSKLPRYQDLLPDPLPHAATDEDLSFLPNKETENPTSPVISSFSSNDSNAENMPPTPKNVITATPRDLNESLINQRQQLNPRRLLGNRSPLNAINILEVITIPPLCPQKSKEKDLNNDVSNKGNITATQNTSKSRVTNMFGFDEFLENDDVTDTDELRVPPEFSEKSNNLSIRDKLHGLKYLRPVLKKPHQSPSVEKPISTVFDDVNGQANTKQRNIKEMFCSTMISHDNEMPAEKPVNKEDFQESNKNGTPDTYKLFIDPDPVASFNEKDNRRTYVRPYKRKRKLRHNFVMFFDSDESGDDESNEKEGINKIGDAAVEHKKKKHRKDPKVNKELNSFVNEFNEMCNDVNQYELVVE